MSRLFTSLIAGVQVLYDIINGHVHFPSCNYASRGYPMYAYSHCKGETQYKNDLICHDCQLPSHVAHPFLLPSYI